MKETRQHKIELDMREIKAAIYRYLKEMYEVQVPSDPDAIDLYLSNVSQSAIATWEMKETLR